MSSLTQINVSGTTYDIDATTLEGKSASNFATASHTQDFSTITNRGEALLSWGG